MIKSKIITLAPKPFGFHLITKEVKDLIQKDIKEVEKGMIFLNLMHTSAGITINENSDPSVRSDLKKFFLKLVPRDFDFDHSLEGEDDMPAHVLASLIGTQIFLPIQSGELVLGTWQGIYLCEFRDYSSGRSIYITIMGS
ncbi:MAG: secondary thiamine-phosphate synthase enzyme YjbQ [Leptonema sp. (in: bacteria)]